jgi:outer membrane protein
MSHFTEFGSDYQVTAKSSARIIKLIELVSLNKPTKDAKRALKTPWYHISSNQQHTPQQDHSMKQLKLAALTASIISPLVFSTVASADTVFGIYAGAGTWESEFSGEAGDPAVTMNDLGAKEESNTFFYIAVEHPVPLIPNIKLQQNNINSKQTSTITQTFSLDGTEFIQGSEVASNLDLSYTDAVLYYEILDNWFNLDIGVTARKYSGHIEAESEMASESVDVDAVIPLIYGKAQFDLPFSGLSAGIEGNYINYSDSSLMDYSAKVSYLFDSVLDLGVEVGYRAITMTIDDEEVQTDIELSGPYAAAIFHF